MSYRNHYPRVSDLHTEQCAINNGGMGSGGLGYPCTCRIHPGRTIAQFDSLPHSEQIKLMAANKPERQETMSSIHLCEGCGAMVTGNAIGVVQVRTSNDMNASETISRELCPGCIGAVLAVVEQERDEPRERAYRKPWTRPETTKEITTGAEALEVLETTITALRKQIEGTPHDRSAEV